MLVRLILFIAAIGALWAAVAWWRNIPRLQSGMGIGEFERLRKLARTHPRLEQALQLRVNVVQAADEDERAELTRKVDSAVQRLGEQLTLRDRITRTLDGIDRERLAREVAGARAQAADADVDDPVHALAEQLTVQLEQVDRLGERKKGLDAAADRLLLVLRNLNLALLEAQSTRATEQSDRVRTVLADLEDAGELLRRTTEAEEEVAKVLAAGRNEVRANLQKRSASTQRIDT